MAGKKWARKVPRKEDMLVYMLRLLLEYARICNDERESWFLWEILTAFCRRIEGLRKVLLGEIRFRWLWPQD